MSSKFSSAFVVTLLLSHTVLAPLTAVAQEQDASPQQVQKTTDSNSNESVEAAQKEGAESIDDGMPDKTPQDASPQQVQGTTDSTLNESAEAAQRVVADPIDNWMPDKALQVAVAGALGLEVSKITKSDMLQLIFLYGDGVGIASLEGLQYASNLSNLSLNGNQITDLTPLRDLSNLSVLKLNGSQVSDLTPLQQLSNLSFLQLSHNQITDLTPLRDLSNLSVLYLDYNPISDFTPLRDLSNLKQLNLNGNHVSDLTLLRDLSNLSALSLDDNQITDLTPLRDLSNLSSLGLNGNQVSDLTPLQQLSKLSNLRLEDNQITDLTPLQQLSNLSFLYLNHNQITDLTPLQQLSNLLILELGSNHISDLTPLQQLSKLSNLKLDDNHITDLTPLKNLNLTNFTALDQTITLPTIYVLNKQPYSASVQTAIKNLNGTTPTISPQNSDSWIGNYSEVDGSGKVEWSSANQVPETGDLVLTWTDQNTNNFSGKYVQPYVLSKASITAHNSTIYVGDNWQARDNFDSALDHDGNPLDFSKIAVAGTVDTSRPGVYSVVYSYDGLEEKVEVTVEEKPSTSEPSKGEVTPEEKPSAPEASKGEVQSKKEKSSKELPATGEKDTKIFSAIGLGILAILAILGTYISRKKRSDS